MRKIPDFIMNGSATLVSTWIQLKEHRLHDFLEMVEFGAERNISPPVCIVALATDLANYGRTDQECMEYCKTAFKLFDCCFSKYRRVMVCNIYASREIIFAEGGRVWMEERLHRIAAACSNKKIPQEVRDFANSPSAAGLDAAFKAAGRT